MLGIVLAASIPAPCLDGALAMPSLPT